MGLKNCGWASGLIWGLACIPLILPNFGLNIASCCFKASCRFSSDLHTEDALPVSTELVSPQQSGSISCIDTSGSCSSYPWIFTGYSMYSHAWSGVSSSALCASCVLPCLVVLNDFSFFHHEWPFFWHAWYPKMALKGVMIPSTPVTGSLPSCLVAIHCLFSL